MASVFQKFGGIRPMASAIGYAPSTINSWHAGRKIPRWHHNVILAVAKSSGIPLTEDELVNVRAEDGAMDIRGRPLPDDQDQGAAA